MHARSQAEAKATEAVPATSSAARAPLNVVVLEGTWSQASKLRRKYIPASAQFVRVEIPADVGARAEL